MRFCAGSNASHRADCLPALVMLLACLAAPGVAAGDPLAIADHLPPNASLAIFSTDLAKLCRHFEATTIGQMLSGDEFGPLVQELRSRNLAGPLNLQPSFGFNWTDLATLASPGGLVLFPLPDGGQGSACLLIATTPAAEVPSCLAIASRYFRQQGLVASEMKRASARLTIFQSAASQKVKTTRVLFIAEGFYGVANSLAAADAILQVRGKQSLAKEEAFITAVSPLAGAEETATSDAQFFVRPLECWETMRATDKAAPEKAAPKAPGKVKTAGKQSSAGKDATKEPQKPDTIDSFRHLGYGGIKAVGGHILFQADDPCEWEIQARLITPRPLERALRLLELQTGRFAGPPDWIPANISSIWRWRWDFATAIKGFGNLFDEANEPGPDGEGMFEDMLDGIRDDPEGVMVDLRRDLFGNLGPDMMTISDHLGHAAEGETARERTLYFVNSRDSATIADTLTRFYKADERVAHEQSSGHDVWTVPAGSSLFVEGESDSVVTVRTLAVGPQQVLFGTDVDMLQVSLTKKSQGMSLRDDPAWQPLLAWIEKQGGSQIAFWALSRLDMTLADSYRAAASEPAEGATTDLFTGLWRALFFGTAEATSQLPFAKVPSYEQVRTALPRAGTFLTPTDQGWTLRIGGARSAQPKAN